MVDVHRQYVDREIVDGGDKSGEVGTVIDEPVEYGYEWLWRVSVTLGNSAAGSMNYKSPRIALEKGGRGRNSIP